MRAFAAWVAAGALVAAAACERGAPRESPVFVTVRIVAAAGGVVVRAEVAATPEARARGLMRRASVPPGTGMVFLFPGPSRVGFYMRNTLVELDIAFIRSGRVVALATMVPCRADPCPLTTPADSYDAALEVATGGLAGVAAGDAVFIEGDVPTPT